MELGVQSSEGDRQRREPGQIYRFLYAVHQLNAD